MTIDELQDILAQCQALLAQVSFDEVKVERRKKIKNSLKILEFIRSSKTAVVEKIVAKKPVMAIPKNIFPMFLLKNKNVSTES